MAKVVDEILKLSREERSAAGQHQLASLDDDEADDPTVVAAEWKAEIERRIADDSPGIPLETVMAEIRASLKQRSPK